MRQIFGMLGENMAGQYRRRLVKRSTSVSPTKSLTKEREFLQQVRYLARQFGWKTYHTFNSQKSEPGFPDLVLVKPPELIICELKTATGKLTISQKEWVYALSSCNVETYVWRPDDLPYIFERLRPKTGSAPADEAGIQ